MTLFINPKASEAAIQTAIKNADKGGYSVRRGGVFYGIQTWGVWKNDNDSAMSDYVVSGNPKGAVCDCEQCNREGYCKHIEIVAREESYLEMIEEQETRYEEMAANGWGGRW